MPRPKNTIHMVRSSYDMPAEIKSWIRKRAFEQQISETKVLTEVLFAGKRLIEESEKEAPNESHRPKETN